MQSIFAVVPYKTTNIFKRLSDPGTGRSHVASKGTSSLVVHEPPLSGALFACLLPIGRRVV